MDRIEKIISDMTLEEKISYCTGADMWNTKSIEKYGVKPVTMSDGPHGLRFQKNGTTATGINKSAPATCFPALHGMKSLCLKRARLSAGRLWRREFPSF